MDADHRDVYAEIARLQEQVRSLYRLMDEREKQVNSLHLAAHRAGDKAEEAQAKINVASNEWRGAMNDARADFARNSEMDSLTERVTNLENADAGVAGRSRGISAAQAVVISLVPVVIALAALIWSIAKP